MEIELATADELIDELAKRFGPVLVAYVREEKVDHDQVGVVTSYRGGWITALGLAHNAAHSLHNSGETEYGEAEEI